MKTLAIKLLKQIIRMMGLRKALKLGWKYAIYPKLNELTKNSDPKWDEKVLKLVDKYIYKAIDMI